MADMKKKRQPYFSDLELIAIITDVSEKQDSLFAKFDSNINVKTILFIYFENYFIWH